MDIIKLGIVDPKIKQDEPKFAVYKGPLSVSNVPSNAISQSNSQHTYNVPVPSLNTFVDRKILWSSTVDVDVTLTVADGIAVAINTVPIDFGGNASVAPYALHSLCTTQSATINDANCTSYTSDTLYEVARLIDSKEQRMASLTPVKLDNLLNYADSDGSISNVLNGFGSVGSPSERGRGSYSGYQFLNPLTGAVLQSGDQYIAGQAGANNVTLEANDDGVPHFQGAVAAAANAYDLTFKIRFFLTEPLMISPFCYNLKSDDEPSLYGINNLQFVFNMNQGKRFLRFMPSNTFTNLDCSISKYSNSQLNTTFYTPNLSVPLPERNVVDYMEMSRFITNGGLIPASTPVQLSDPSHSSAQIISQSIVFNSIPDMVLVYVKANDITNQQGDYYLPINKISVSFDNFAGLLSNNTPQQLYNMSYSNGLQMTYDEYIGAYNFSNSTDGKCKRPSVGSFLVLKMGRDIPLQSGLSPGIMGNFNFQINVSLRNQTGQDVQSANLFVCSVKSGFFETVNGSSRIITAPVTESDVIASKNVNTSYSMKRMIGSGFFSSLGNALSKVKEYAPVVKNVLKATGHPKAKQAVDVMESVGLGRRTGGARTGGKARISNLY